MLCELILWLLFVMLFFYNVGNYGFVFWMLMMVKVFGLLSNFEIGLVSVFLYLVVLVVMVVNV